MEPLILPQLGESTSEAQILAWRVGPGDKVRRGQALAEIETDKVTMELAAEYDCTIVRIVAPAGAIVAVGAVLAELAPAGPIVAVGDGPTDSFARALAQLKR